MGGMGHTLRRKGTAKGAAENVITVLSRYMGLSLRDYDIHLNFPGGTPVDGPSAGVSMAVAIYSSLTGYPADPLTAMTGELSVRGFIRPIGGVQAKIEAAVEAGIKKIIIPQQNWQQGFKYNFPARIMPVNRLEEVFKEVILVD